MTLQSELEKLKKEAANRFTPEVRAQLDKFKNNLAEIKRNVPALGAKLPAFSLPDQDGNLVLSSDLLSKNNRLFIVFFRGAW